MECFDHGTHNETWQCYGYFDAISRFLCEVYIWAEKKLQNLDLSG